MGQIFQLAKDFVSASLETSKLAGLPGHGDALPSSISRRVDSRTAGGALYELCRRHDRIDVDLVDRAAPHVVGGYLWDKSREPCTCLPAAGTSGPRSSAPGSSSAAATWMTPDRSDSRERPPRPGAEGGRWLDREAGKRDDQRLRDYLDRNAATMLARCHGRLPPGSWSLPRPVTERLEPELKFDRK